METYCHYEIRVKGTLSEKWSSFFEELEILTVPGGETILKGQIPDQSALFGILSRIHSLNLELTSVEKKSSE